MRAAVIESGLVVNVIEVDSVDFLPNLVDASNEGAIGDSYADGVFTPAPPPPIPVPQQISMRQAKLMLLQAGYYDLVQPYIDGLTEPMKTAANISWNSGTCERDNEFVAQIGTALGMTDEQIDDLFIQAQYL